MPFIEINDIAEREVLPGCKARIVHADNMTLVYWSFDPGTVIPEHSHPHEQVANLLDGEFELTVGGETRGLRVGSVATIPSDTPHSGKAITAARILDVFHPIREDLL